jgi:hypothetical protein
MPLFLLPAIRGHCYAANRKRSATRGGISMRAPLLRMLLASSLMLASTPWPASAQFGLPGLPRIGRVPLHLPGPGRILGRGLHFGKFRRAFGIIGAVAVGGVILGRLSRRDGAEVTRRTRVALDKTPDQEVIDTYRTTDGNNQVTITAGPTQKVADIKDDPALRTTADTIQQTSGETEGKSTERKGSESKNSESKSSAAKNTADTKPDADVVRIDQLPADAQCRKVTTEMETKSSGKKADKADKADSKSTNTSILCQMNGEWKPASA